MKNFIAKFLLDQSVGSVLNIMLFLVLITLLKGEGLRRVWEAVVTVCFLPGFRGLGLMNRTSNRS